MDLSADLDEDDSFQRLYRRTPRLLFPHMVWNSTPRWHAVWEMTRNFQVQTTGPEGVEISYHYRRTIVYWPRLPGIESRDTPVVF